MQTTVKLSKEAPNPEPDDNVLEIEDSGQKPNPGMTGLEPTGSRDPGTGFFQKIHSEKSKNSPKKLALLDNF